MTPGTKLGPYEILAQIGAGGMGEVYRARDAKLGRDVALKVLPEAFARDTERMARFQREAKLLAALNHTNIASIYGLEDSGDTHALVMELAEGPTLADRLKAGPIPVDEALPIAKQICDALEYAHEKGIVHRDLKPANIKIAADDTVKILDFGLAKALEADTGSLDISTSPTISRLATMQGVLLGTAAYMSPEQAKGKPVDRRADIWAFGCVLYEMLTGKKAFDGETITDTLAAVLKNEPDWSRLPVGTPMRVRVLLQRCLQKDVRQRLQAIGDARISLEEVFSGAQEPVPGGVESVSVPIWRRPLFFGVVVASISTVVALALGFIVLRTPPSTAPETMRFEIPMPQGVAPAVAAEFAVSPDGRQLAFFGVGADGVTRLWVRPLDSLQARPLPGSETPLGPAFSWSPDSRYIAFDAGGKLKKIAIAGGPAQTICDVTGTVLGGSWNRDGVIIFGGGPGLMRVPAAGGTATPLTALDPARKEIYHSLPVFLPDGRHFVYFRNSSSADYTGAYVGSLDVKPEAQSLKPLVATPFGVEYVPSPGKGTGYLLFVRDNSLLAQAFDPDRLKLSGEPVEIADHLGNFTDRAYFSVSANGVMVYRSGSESGFGSQLTWLDRQGQVQGPPITQQVGSTLDIAISPDAQRAALTQLDLVEATGVVWLHDFQRGTTTRFTFGSASAALPIWSPDGKTLMFLSILGGRQNLYEKPADGSRNEQLVLKSTSASPTSWSHDGRFVLYTHQDPKTNKAGVWVLPINGDGKPFPLLQSSSNETDAQFSPNGHWVAYVSDESGRNEIFVTPFSLGATGGVASSGAKWQISVDGGSEPRWREDGKELYYESADSKIMAVDIATAPSFRAGVPSGLFQAPPVTVPAPGTRPWDVTPDGKRFLFITSGAPRAQAPFTVLLNWTSLLKQSQ
jgi:eukaryotic-like serine/threonine-protein kinase